MCAFGKSLGTGRSASSPHINDKPLLIGIVAGEKSGDILGAGLIAAILKRYPDAEFIGVGGDKMLAHQFASIVPLERLSVMGLIEPLKRLPELLRLRRNLIDLYLTRHVDIFIGIDSPDFNLGIAKKLKSSGIKTVQYVCPSVWAWRQGRVKKIRNSVDHVLALLPFEQKFLAKHAVPATFVGHPLADILEPALDEKNTEYDVCIMPGSRSVELKYSLDVFLLAMQILSRKNPSLKFVIPAATDLLYSRIEAAITSLGDEAFRAAIKLKLGVAQDCVSRSKVILQMSGTATLEAALLGRPMVVAYKMSKLGFSLVSRMAKVDHIALPNLLLEERVVPELVQDEATPEKLAHEVKRLLDDPEQRAKIRKKFKALHQVLAKGASDIAAQTVLKLITPA